MHASTSLLIPFLALLTPSTSIHQSPRSTSTSTTLQNANHIFNSIHDSMRQFGSSLNHNGMNFFVANVPAHTQFYHGTGSQYRINGTEWLAFEPEHSMLFARARRGDGPGGRRGPGGGDESRPPVEDQARSFIGSPSTHAKQKPLRAGEAEESPIEQRHGYLHTYRTRQPLRLLYVDGQSAAKSSKGTLDTQDVVLRNLGSSSGDSSSPGGDGMSNEYTRAADLCDLASGDWGGRIDGILRMEGGFEVILCDFERDLELEGIRAARGDLGVEDRMSYNAAVAARYGGIGAGRVMLESGGFVSLYAYEGGVVWDETGRPRAENDTSLLEKVRRDIKEMALGSAENDFDWQGKVVDQLVARYADRIEYIASGQLTTAEALSAEIDRAIRPFIDYTSRNATLEALRCAAQFLPHALPTTPSTASMAITEVTRIICTTLTVASLETSHSKALAMVWELKGYLNWTTWRRCRGCGMHDICQLPIWPRGSAEDFVQPKCASGETFTSGDYWGGRGGGGGGGGRGGNGTLRGTIGEDGIVW